MKGGELQHEYLFDGGFYQDGEMLASFTQTDISTQGGRGGFGRPGRGGGFPGGGMPQGGFPAGPGGFGQREDNSFIRNFKL